MIVVSMGGKMNVVTLIKMKHSVPYWRSYVKLIN